MPNYLRVLLYASVLCGVAFRSPAQDPPAPEQQNAKDTFFSGNVVALTTDRVTVTRRTFGVTAITKVFILDANTRVEGKLQVKARVTVRFEKTADGERAIRILVR